MNTKPLREFLRGPGRWYDLPEIAKAAPVAFVEAMLDQLVSLASPFASTYSTRDRKYRACFELDQELDDENALGSDFVVAFVRAFDQLATAHHEHFKEALGRYLDVDLMLLHRIFARCLTANIANYAADAVRYVLGDERRLALGYHGDQEDSIVLISALAEHLDAETHRQLEDYITGWRGSWSPPADAEPRTRLRAARAGRLERLRLLMSCNQELLSDAGRREVCSGQRAFAEHDLSADRWSPEMREIKSSMTTQQMLNADTDHILRLFDRLRGRIVARPAPWHADGMLEHAARQLQEVAKADAAKGLRVLWGLSQEDLEIAAGGILEGLAEGQLPPDQIVGIVRELEQRGLRSREYRHGVARTVEVSAISSEQRDEMVGLISGWLEPAASEGDGRVWGMRPEGEAEPDNVQSVLWQSVSFARPGGNYPLLHSITSMLLNVEPVSKGRWVDLLATHLARDEDPQVWSVLLWDNIGNLIDAGADRASAFLRDLFQRHPGVPNTTQTLVLAGRVQRHLDRALTQWWLETLMASNEPQVAQAAGEILVVRHASLSDAEWTTAQIESVLGTEPKDDVERHVKLGVALGLGEMWGYDSNRAQATDMLLRLIPSAGPLAQAGVLRAFARSGPLSLDDYVRRLIDAVIAQPGMLANSNSSFLIELLLEYARLEPERLYRACAALLDVVGGAVGDIRSAHSFAASYIVDAAAALHQIDEENRARAVDLIERMTALGVEEASDFLRSFDGTRDAKPRSPTPRRRRRRRHRRPRAVRRSR